MNKKEPVVTRILPSPTGHLHIGTARTALYNYLYAKKRGGHIVYRSEDTDKERSKPEFEKEIREGLEWLGIHADEHHKQSERGDVYSRYLKQVIDNSTAYISKEESRKEPGMEVEIVRLKNPNRTVAFHDEIRGEITFDTTELGDIVIARAIDDALYHFAVVVDDFEMGVTHVIRGEDHISNTPRQILIQEALGIEPPVYAHIPLILASDRSKMSKRHGAVSLFEYKSEGYLPEALINYFALLGWNPGNDREIFSIEELVETFDLSGIQKGGAVFDLEKLRWFNKEYLNKLPDERYLLDVLKRIPESIKELPSYSDERVRKLLPTIRERTHVYQDLTYDFEKGEYNFAFEKPELQLEMLKWKNDASTKDVLPRLQKVLSLLEQLDEDTNVEKVKDAVWPYALKVGKGEVLWPLRVALTGKEKSPDPFTIIHVIGPKEAVERIKKACDTIKSA